MKLEVWRCFENEIPGIKVSLDEDCDYKIRFILDNGRQQAYIDEDELVNFPTDADYHLYLECIELWEFESCFEEMNKEIFDILGINKLRLWDPDYYKRTVWQAHIDHVNSIAPDWKNWRNHYYDEPRYSNLFIPEVRAKYEIAYKAFLASFTESELEEEL